MNLQIQLDMCLAASRGKHQVTTLGMWLPNKVFSGIGNLRTDRDLRVLGIRPEILMNLGRMFFGGRGVDLSAD